jgi:hypothetical protein
MFGSCTIITFCVGGNCCSVMFIGTAINISAYHCSFQIKAFQNKVGPLQQKVSKMSH